MLGFDLILLTEFVGCLFYFDLFWFDYMCEVIDCIFLCSVRFLENMMLKNSVITDLEQFSSFGIQN